MRTPDVRMALHELRAQVTEVLPFFDQFERALATENADGRWQLANAALNGIKLRLAAN